MSGIDYGCGHTALNEDCPFCRRITLEQRLRNNDIMFIRKEMEKARNSDKDSQEFLTAWIKGEI